MGETAEKLALMYHISREDADRFAEMSFSRAGLVQMNDNECEPMFLSFFVVLGLFLLLAVKRPPEHRSLIAFAAWWSLFHAAVMAVQTFEAWNRGTHRDYADVVIAGIVGAVLLAITPTKPQRSTASRAAATVVP